MDLAGRREIDSGVVKLERPGPWSECLLRRVAIEPAAVDEDTFNHDRRSGRDAHRVRLDHCDAFDGRKPQFAVGGLPGDRLRAAITFAALHAVRFSVSDGSHLRLQPFGNGIELLSRYAEDPLVATDPEESVVVFLDGEDAVVEKTFASGDGRPAAAFVSTDSSAGGSNPDRAGVVLI